MKPGGSGPRELVEPGDSGPRELEEPGDSGPRVLVEPGDSGPRTLVLSLSPCTVPPPYSLPEPLEADPDRLLIVGSFDSAAYLFLLLPPLPADGEVAELCAAMTLGDVEP